ncbi:MAG: Dihydrolipoyllysine-residue acetyltransferase component of pyruvate dehydrogenase complex [Opitutia bacterium UBA7350]|nr:MAG: Dihydrolipoyllysine-residue acetyltransferase component of pyruvate dehydrogenase complex [Opitutae bacterium UBA7350]
MATLIDMPKLSDTMTVGTLVKWLKKEGDAVANGDMIAEVETDKATMEVECFEDGILLKQYSGAGDEVPVGGAIAAIGEAGETAPEVSSSSTVPSEEPKKESPTPATPAAKTVPLETPAPAPTPAAAVALGTKIKASPLAKKIAADKGIDLAGIQGSGPGGRIVKADVLEAKSGTVAAGPPAPGLEALNIPVTNMRKSIARALVGSKTQAPHFYLQIEVDGAPLASFRKALNAKYADLPTEQGGMKFSVNDLTLKAAAEAIRKVPIINRSWEGETIAQHANVHLAFGVAIDDGLLTPVIRNAESKSLHQISAEAKDLIKKARGKKLTPEEMSGSTLTVTNLGMFGISDFYGIINPNNAAILSIGATLKKPVVDEHNQIVIGQTMKIGLSGDHRTIDGAVGAQYLQALKEILENPALMLI